MVRTGWSGQADGEKRAWGDGSKVRIARCGFVNVYTSPQIRLDKEGTQRSPLYPIRSGDDYNRPISRPTRPPHHLCNCLSYGRRGGRNRCCTDALGDNDHLNKLLDDDVTEAVAVTTKG